MHFLITILLVVNSAPAISQTRAYRVGVLTLGGQDRPHLKGLRDGLKEAGYIEGKTLLLEMPLTKTPDELRVVANTFVSEKKDLIVTLGNIETTIAHETTRADSYCLHANVRPGTFGLREITSTSWHKCYRSYLLHGLERIW